LKAGVNFAKIQRSGEIYANKFKTTFFILKLKNLLCVRVELRQAEFFLAKSRLAPG